METDLNITGTSETMTIEYNIVSATVGCRVWDDQNQKWDKTHCTVLLYSVFESMFEFCSAQDIYFLHEIGIYSQYQVVK